MLDAVLNLISGWGEGVKILFISMLPISELRGAIPLGIIWGIAPWQCFFWAIIGNFIPIVPLYFLFPLVYRLILRIGVLRRHLLAFVDRTRRKGRQVEKYGALGLMMFVAVPLPGTGVWTGVAVALLLGIEFKYTLFAVTSGMILAGIAVTLASMGVLAISEFIFGIELLTILVLVVIVVYWIYKKNKRI